MKKLSSYQKLKAENEQLKADLRELAANPSSERSILIKMCEIYQQKIDDLIWHGSYNPSSTGLDVSNIQYGK